MSPIEVYCIKSSILKSSHRGIPWTLVSGMKMLFAVLLILVSGLETTKAIVHYASGRESHPVQYYTPVIKLVTYVFVTILMSWNRRKAITSSVVLFLFWLLLSLSSGFSFYSLWRDLLHPVSCAKTYIS
jgi:ATP-binding cassette subfamily C (CFTR/MRP) protein 1